MLPSIMRNEPFRSVADNPVYTNLMYHLFVSSSADAWRGHTATLQVDRCLRSGECTPAYLIDEYCTFKDAQNALLTQLPAVFAYETILKQDARVGRVNSI
jgi:hypothetical protein